MTSTKWYKEGLRFGCTECGQCCTGEPGYVWVEDAEIAAMAAHLKLSEATFRKHYVRIIEGRLSLIEKANYDCIFLREKKCRIYKVRPKQCQSFPWWPQNLKSEASWKEAARRCEGINAKAPLIPSEEIERQLNEESSLRDPLT